MGGKEEMTGPDQKQLQERVAMYRSKIKYEDFDKIME